jgi:uncharacterized membrane protein (DUF373 family)|tara:strand:- start:617 stop:820 length:204 start_codon:yes stop_codon:yes gene_type:complete
MSGLNPINLILIVNSLSVIGLVITQNETTRDEISKKSSVTNPLEKLLWVLVIFELITLLIQTKVSDF